MKKHETFSGKEELLAQILEECLEEDLSFVPPEREIARRHRFSEEFENTMREMLENTSNETRKKEIKKHFSPRYGQWAACVLVFCICGGLFYYLSTSFYKTGSSEEAAADTIMEESAPEEETAEGTAPEAVEEAPEAEAADSAGTEKASDDAGSEPEPEKTYCGQTVYLAEQQEVPESLEYVTTLVNCPVLDEENPSLVLTIGNTGEEPIRYLNHYGLEVFIDGAWYVIPEETGTDGEWLTLEAGMAVDEEIDLSDYQIRYDAQRYRLIAHVEEETVSAEFTFENVFTEMMETTEEKSSAE